MRLAKSQLIIRLKNFKYAKSLVGLIALYAMLIAPAHSWAQRGESRSSVERAADAVCGKWVVVLGELPSHGESRTFQAKAQIVERLVKRCGFDALLFEAPIYDFIGLQSALAENSTAPVQLDRAIGRFWLTRELSDWRRWLFRQAKNGELVLGGLDDQVSATSEYARAALPKLVAASLSPQSASECEQAVARNLYWRYDAGQPFDETEQLRLQHCTRNAADALKVRALYRRATPEQVMLENLANYAARQRSAPEARDRDEAMFRNALWYKERMPADSKLIIWTSTVHAARRQGQLSQLPLGARLSERLGNRLAVVGFTALGGQSSRAGQPSQPLSAAPPGSLEARSTDTDADWIYLNSSALRRIGNVQSRLLGKFTSTDWSKYFDAVLVIGQESAPVFEQR